MESSVTLIEGCESCDVCGGDHTIVECPELGILDLPNAFSTQTRARLTLPDFVNAQDDEHGICIMVTQPLPARTMLGPYESKRTMQELNPEKGFVLKVFSDGMEDSICLDTTNERDCNWLCLVPTATNPSDQNCMATQIGRDIFYITTCHVGAGQQLRVWYAPSYARKLGRPVQPDGKTCILLGRPLDDLLVYSFSEPKLLEIVFEQVPGNSHKINADGSTNPEKQYQDDDLPAVKMTVTPRPLVLNHNGDEVARPRYQCSRCSEIFGDLVLLARHTKSHLTGQLDVVVSELCKRPAQKSRRGRKRKVNGDCKDEIDAEEDLGVNNDGETEKELSMDEIINEENFNLSKKRKGVNSPNRRSTRSVKRRFHVMEVLGKKNKFVSNKANGRNVEKTDDLDIAGEVSIVKAEPSQDDENFNDESLGIALDIIKMEECQKTLNKQDVENMVENTEEDSLGGCVDEEAGLGSSQQVDDDNIDDVVLFEEEDHRDDDTEEDDDVDDVDDDGIVLEHVCKICSKGFSQSRFLKRHLNLHIYKYHCKTCSKPFATQERMKKHECEHAAGKKLECEFCGAEFKTSQYLVRHMAFHTREFECTECKRWFARKETLLAHIAQYHPMFDGVKSFSCDLCSRILATEASLNNHRRSHFSGGYNCEYCQRDFASKMKLRVHNCIGELIKKCSVVATREGHFKCTKCGKVLRQKQALRRHLVKHTDELACQLCGKQFGRTDDLFQHTLDCVASAELSRNGSIKCGMCMDEFNSPREFREHYRQHTHPYKCADCGRFFKRLTKLNDHSCSKELQGASLECHVCKKVLSNKMNLQRHALVHAGNNFMCEFCGMTFKRGDYLKDHKCVVDDSGAKARIKRTKDKEEVIHQVALVCSVCGKNFANVSNLNKHVVTHGEKKEVCESCGKKFHLKASLRDHVLFVHEGGLLLPCPVCDKQLKGRNSLHSHILRFHPESRNRDAPPSFKCEQCGKVFHQSGNLRKHELCHSDQLTYKCSECDMQFKFPEQLRRHSLRHKFGTRHSCHLCDRRFVMEFELKNHIDVYHGAMSYHCKYCGSTCRHLQAIKRHLQHRHIDITEWQLGGTNFLKSLRVRNQQYVNVKANNSLDSSEKTVPPSSPEPASDELGTLYRVIQADYPFETVDVGQENSGQNPQHVLADS